MNGNTSVYDFDWYVYFSIKKKKNNKIIMFFFICTDARMPQLLQARCSMIGSIYVYLALMKAKVHVPRRDCSRRIKYNFVQLVSYFKDSHIYTRIHTSAGKRCNFPLQRPNRHSSYIELSKLTIQICSLTALALATIFWLLMQWTLLTQ